MHYLLLLLFTSITFGNMPLLMPFLNNGSTNTASYLFWMAFSIVSFNLSISNTFFQIPFVTITIYKIMYFIISTFLPLCTLFVPNLFQRTAIQRWMICSAVLFEIFYWWQCHHVLPQYSWLRSIDCSFFLVSLGRFIVLHLAHYRFYLIIYVFSCSLMTHTICWRCYFT